MHYSVCDEVFRGWGKIGPHTYRTGNVHRSVMVVYLADSWGYLLLDLYATVLGGRFCWDWDGATARDEALKALKRLQAAGPGPASGRAPGGLPPGPPDGPPDGAHAAVDWTVEDYDGQFA